MPRKNLLDWVLWEDSHFLAINKPSGISCLDERGSKPEEALVRLVKNLNPSWSLAHRIDKDTSGVLLISKSSESYGHLAQQFESHEMGKLYLVIAQGKLEAEEKFFEYPILKTNNGFGKVSPKGKWAGTWIKGLKEFNHYTMLQAMPVSGRFHQIRVHLSHEGHPLAGDEKYGGKLPYLSEIKRNYRPKRDSEETPLMPRMALHAFKIRFQDMKGNQVEVESPVPTDFQRFIKALEKYDS